MFATFTPAHRGGSGPPLVCLHGFMETWRSWELALPALARRHEVLAPTLPGHAGGAPAPTGLDEAVDAVERALDGAGFETAHLAGTSLGGYLALRLAERGRARSVVAFAPAGGWADGAFAAGLFARQEAVHAQLVAAAPTVDTLVATPDGRRRATELVTERSEHLPPELVAHLLVGGARADAANLLATARQAEWSLDPDRVDVPVRIVWGTADRLLPWPEAAARWREGLPRAEWVVLDGVGHAVQLDVPLEAAELILGVTAR